MKKLMALSLLIVYCSSQLGILAWYYGKSFIHMASANLQSFRNVTNTRNRHVMYYQLDAKFCEKKINNGEISLNGILYDISEKKIEGSKVILTLEKDEIESMLLNHYDHLVNWIRKHHHSKASEEFVLSWMLKSYCFDQQGLFQDWTLGPSLKFPHCEKHIVAVYGQPPTKPPQKSSAELPS